MALREDAENGQPKVYWVTHGASLLRCSPDQIRPIVERVGEPTRPTNLQAAQATLQGLRRGGIVQFFDISQLPGPTDEDLEYEPMEEENPTPAAGGTPTVEQAMAGQLRPVSMSQGSEPQAEAKIGKSRDTSTNCGDYSGTRPR